MSARLRAAFLCTMALAACDRSGPPKGPPGGDEPPPAVTPPTAKTPTKTKPPPVAPPDSGVSGKVLETMDAGGYTYVRIAAPAGEVWAAVNQTRVAIGDTVTIINATEMKNFESKTLGRTFPSILFGSLGGGGAATTPPVPGPIAVDQPLARAAGANGRTVAEVFAQKATLVDQPVAVRGKVTKYNSGILGKNWLHLQDGTGTAAQRDFDLVVTTSATAAVGDVVVATGVVHTDRDFGGGYAYDVLVEDATLAVDGK